MNGTGRERSVEEAYKELTKAFLGFCDRREYDPFVGHLITSSKDLLMQVIDELATVLQHVLDDLFGIS